MNPATFLLILAVLATNDLLAVTRAAELTIRQVNTSSSTSWLVRGLATYEVGVSPTVYHFQCTTSNLSQQLSWSRQGGGIKGQTLLSNGVNLLFTNPTADDAGTYFCRDSVNNDNSVTLNITLANPAVGPAAPGNMIAQTGDTVVIEFYASSLPEIQASNVIWRLNGAPLTNGNFSFNKRILTLSNVTTAMAGRYTFTVANVNASTELIVLVPPSFTTQPLNASNVLEWSSFSLNCTVTGSLPLHLNWFKINGDLPKGSNETIVISEDENTVSAVLTVDSIRVADSGQYACNSSFVDGSYSMISQTAFVTVRGSLRTIYHPLEGESTVIQSPLLYTTSSSFYIECQGSGELYWTLSNNSNVSMSVDDVPHQVSAPMSFRRLNFTSFDSQLDGNTLYKCKSTLGAVTSVYISSDNPVIYTAYSTITVYTLGPFNTTITVYIGGSNPVPSAQDVTWYFNGSIITTENSHLFHYDGLDNTVLSITALNSSDIVGMYEARVNTSQRHDSVFVYISYPDPPVISTIGEKVVVEGDNVELACNISFTRLNFTIAWRFNGSTELPDGAVRSGLMLQLDNVTRNHSGYYQCFVFDGIASHVEGAIQLIVQYSPVASLFTANDSRIEDAAIILEEGSIPSPVYCLGVGVPLPSVMWSFNSNQSFPSGVVMQELRSNYLKLSWSRPVSYTDEGQYACTATNALDSSTVLVNINVNATPVIYSIYSTSDSAGLLQASTSLITFSCPTSQSNCNMTCVARGWPTPTVHWRQDAGGDVVNRTQYTESGIAVAVIEVSSGSFTGHCQATNEYGTVLQSVRLVSVANETDPVIAPKLPPPAVTGNSVVLRFRILTEKCLNSSLREAATIRSLRWIIPSQCRECHTFSLTSLGSGCDGNASLVLLNLSSLELMRVYSAVAEWWSQGPTMVMDGRLFAVDTQCNLIAQSNSLMCDDTDTLPSITPSLVVSISSTMTTSTGAGTTISVQSPDPNNEQLLPMVALLAASIVGLLILLVAIIIGILVTCFAYHKNYRSKSNRVECNLVDYHNSPCDNSNDTSPSYSQNETTFNCDTSTTRQLQTTPPSSNNTLINDIPHHYDQVFENPYDVVQMEQPPPYQSPGEATNDISPTRNRVTQVPIRENDYQLPFEHHQYATLMAPSEHQYTDVIKNTSTSSPQEQKFPYGDRDFSPPAAVSTAGQERVISPPAPYTEPVSSVGDLTSSFAERRNFNHLKLPPLINHQSSSLAPEASEASAEQEASQPWYSSTDDTCIVTPTMVKYTDPVYI